MTTHPHLPQPLDSLKQTRPHRPHCLHMPLPPRPVTPCCYQQAILPLPLPLALPVLLAPWVGAAVVAGRAAGGPCGTGTAPPLAAACRGAREGSCCALG
ncbi:unnamed protein product [Closterium sp. NIES-53]